MSDLRCPDLEIDLARPSSSAAGTACRRRRLPLRWLLLAAIICTSFGVGRWYGALSSASSVRGDRERAMRLADQSVREAFAGRWRDAYLAAGMARHADPSLPGLELIIAQMLYNAGNPAGAAGLAHKAQQRGEDGSVSALLLGLEAWRNRGSTPNATAWHRADWLASFWLQQASSDSPGDAAPHYFLAELERLTGKGRGYTMQPALHRFRPWQSAWILESKIQLASAESNGVYNAGELRASTRLDDSPQAVAVRVLHRGLAANSSSDEGLRGFNSAFTETHQRILLSDPALSRAHLPPKLSQGPLVR